MSAAPLPGDPSPREDDRYLFLEAILAARDCLRISYVGRSLKDCEEYPPSVVVSELLDYLDQAITFPEPKETARGRLVLHHRLHAFSPAYFEPGSRLFSYSAANCAAAVANRAGPQPEPAFLATPMEAPGEEGRNVELASLISFFDRPAASFLRQRLSIRPGYEEGVLEENEPMLSNALSDYQVRKEMLDGQIAGETAAGAGLFAARALVPAGSVGDQVHAGLRRSTDTFLATVAGQVGATLPDPPFPIDLHLGAFTLTGRLDALYRGRLAFFRPSTVNPKDRLRAWIQHLAWCAAAEAPPASTLVIGRSETLLFPALSREEATERLTALLEIYWRGQSRPLPFFPITSFEFATPRKSTVSPLRRARGKWRGGPFTEGGERDHPAYRLCFGDRDPLDAEFESLALAVFGSMRIEKPSAPRKKSSK